MKEKEAAEAFQQRGWDVWAKPDKVGGWILFATPARGDGTGLLYGFSSREMRALVLAGHVKQRT